MEPGGRRLRLRSAGQLAATTVLLTSWAIAGTPSTDAVAAAATSSSDVTAAATDPSVAVAVGGEGVGMYPAFDPATHRYAVTTTADTHGSVTVTASAGPAGVVRVDGRPVSGPTTLTGLQPGDEISVFLDTVSPDGVAGHAAYSLFVLPAGFPTLARTTPGSSVDDLQPGLTLLTLGLYTPGAPFYEVAVDANGVPAWVHQDASALDLRRQPDGRISVARSTAEVGRTGSDIVVLGPDMEPVATHRTVGLVNTDSHDSILLPDGRRFLVAYERDPATGLVDAVIQGADASGSVFFEWNSADHLVRSPRQDTLASSALVDRTGDYAHINSITLTPDGDLLASFRHLSSIWKIALTAHDGYAPGQVVWRLGGRDSDFDFTAAGDATYPSDGTDGGPCAQHTAEILANGNLLFWDNGSANFSTPYCVDGADKDAAPVARPRSRAVEMTLTPPSSGQRGTASVVWSYSEPGRHGIFAGSARRMPNGNTLVGWAADTVSIATEVDLTGVKLWELVDAAPERGQRMFTYRAERSVLPDWSAPDVSVDSPADGLRIDEGAVMTVDFGCTDVGGSTLQTCVGSADDGGRLDTATPGPHAFTVRAVDGAGRRTTVTRRYRVLPSSRPDLLGRAVGSSRLSGEDRYSPAKQGLTVRSARSRGCTIVRVENDGVRPDQLRVHTTSPGGGWRTSWRTGGQDVTARVSGPGLLLRTMAPGGARQLCLRGAAPRVERGSQLFVRVTSEGSGVTDRLRVHLRP